MKYLFKNILRFLSVVIASIFLSGMLISCHPPLENVGDEETGLATIYISCSAVLESLDKLDKGIADYVPHDGVILDFYSVSIFNKDTPISLLRRVALEKNIPLDASKIYVSGINHLKEKSCTTSSGWVVFVNGSFLSVGAASYVLRDGDIVQWHFSLEQDDVAAVLND